MVAGALADSNLRTSRAVDATPGHAGRAHLRAPDRCRRRPSCAPSDRLWCWGPGLANQARSRVQTGCQCRSGPAPPAPVAAGPAFTQTKRAYFTHKRTQREPANPRAQGKTIERGFRLWLACIPLGPNRFCARCPGASRNRSRGAPGCVRQGAEVSRAPPR